MKPILLFILALCPTLFCFSNTWYVGSSRTYTLPSQVGNLVNDGDTVYIDGGTYNNNAVKWNKMNLKIIGLGTESNRTILKYTGDIPNGKGIFVFELPGTCDNAYIENIVFDGAQVSDANGFNGAGIRYQANNLTVNNCKFMNCQNGILEGHGSVTTSNVTIINSEFENNGYQLQNSSNSGYAHNIYISASTDTLVVQNCYFHHPRGQANSLKTRAQRSFILYNLIDEDSGYGSWEINIAQGGLNVIMGNIIIQGPSGNNHGIIGYDAATNALEDFYFVNNTVINKYTGNIKYFNVAPASGISTFKVYNNIFASVAGASNTFMTGNIPAILDTSYNLITSNYLSVGFANPSANDFNLSATANGVIDMGIDAGVTNTGYSLTPEFAYQSFTKNLAPRAVSGNAIDLGAYESATLLPLSGVTMFAVVNNSNVSLNWKTVSSSIIQQFELERSLNGINYETIGVIQSAKEANAYNYIDEGILKKVDGTKSVYYRLKYTHLDGSIEYTKVVSVAVDKGTSPIAIYPNPFHDNLVIKLTANKNAKAFLRIIDKDGKQVIPTFAKQLTTGVNYISLNGMNKLAPGIYAIKVNYDAANYVVEAIKE